MNEIEHEGILAIFLAEAEEIVQRLSEQLAELRYGYDGQRILDDIHRGFHTLYGGATVLKLDELAECTQLAERVMERVRTRRVSMTPSLVSLFVATLGATELMLARRINHQEPSAIDGELKLRLLRAADRNNSPSAANNPLESFSDPMSVFFDGRLRPRDKQLTDLAPSVLQYERASFTPLPHQTASESPARVAVESTGLESFQSYSGTDFETLDAVVSAPLRQSQAELNDVSGADTASNLDNLVGELSWVRQRLMKFHGKGHSAELDKALVYLDLVTQDFERLKRRGGKNN
ncbi:MAG: two-component system chemotaxis sensor kinase CheA [Zhongshania marina]